MLLLTHDFPDPDALACASALQHLADRAFGIASRIAYGGVIGRMENREMVRILRIPARRFRRRDLDRHRSVALLDTQPGFENNPFPAGRRATIVIDQHRAPRPPDAELGLVDPGCGASSVIVAEALLKTGLDIPPRVATALAYGIVSDTANLLRPGARLAGRTYLNILPKCDLGALARIQHPTRPKEFFATMAEATRAAEVCGGFVSAHVGRVRYPDLVALIADFLMSYRRARWCLCTGRYRNRLHASLRSATTRPRPSDILRAALAGVGSAGGHGSIAGGQWRLKPGSPERRWRAAETSLRDRIVRRLGICRSGRFDRRFSGSAAP
jgi:nanoRNase/pAp phosphatase (c-di-AMP/oligoRNAs hydrolase)